MSVSKSFACRKLSATIRKYANGDYYRLNFPEKQAKEENSEIEDEETEKDSESESENMGEDDLESKNEETDEEEFESESTDSESSESLDLYKSFKDLQSNSMKVKATLCDENYRM